MLKCNVKGQYIWRPEGVNLGRIGGWRGGGGIEEQILFNFCEKITIFTSLKIVMKSDLETIIEQNLYNLNSI